MDFIKFSQNWPVTSYLFHKVIFPTHSFKSSSWCGITNLKAVLLFKRSLHVSRKEVRQNGDPEPWVGRLTEEGERWVDAGWCWAESDGFHHTWWVTGVNERCQCPQSSSQQQNFRCMLPQGAWQEGKFDSHFTPLDAFKLEGRVLVLQIRVVLIWKVRGIWLGRLFFTTVKHTDLL